MTFGGSLISRIVIWMCIFFLAFVLLAGHSDWRDHVDLPSSYLDHSAALSLTGFVEESSEVVFLERKLSRLELLRNISSDFFDVVFVENDSLPGRSDLWRACDELGWVDEGQLVGGELFVSGQEAASLFSVLWGGGVTIEAGEITDTTYDAITQRIRAERNRFPLTRARALVTALEVLREYRNDVLDSSAYDIDDLNYLDVEEDYYIPYLREATSRRYIVGDWADSTFEPDSLVTKPEVLDLIYSILAIDIPNDMTPVSYALSNGLILRTEMGSYRLPKPIKYGEFRKILFESKRVFKL